MNISHAFGRFCLLGLCLVITSELALAQSQAASGQIVGTVTDPNGGVVPGAKVTITSLDTGGMRELVTNEVGQYRAVLLPAGRYKVAVESTGFAPASATDIVVNVGTAVDVNFTLKLGAVAETIEVSAPLVEVTRSEPGAVVNDRAILNLPIDGRRFHDFVTLTPAAVVEGRRQQISILGQRGIYTSVNIDGADYNEPFFGGIRGGERSNFAFTVPQDSIAEFQVITAAYAAEFGRSTGGVVTAITKSGGNDLHGTAFYLLRQKELGVKDALNRQSLENRQQFGGSLGGPIRRDRMFFFGAAEKQYSRLPRQVSFPTLGATPRTPANTEAWDFFNTLQESFTQTNDPLAVNGRFDYQFRRGHRFFARYNHSRNDEANAASVGDKLNPLTTNALSNNGTESDRTHTANGQMVSLLSPALANELRFQYSREERPRTANALSPTVSTTVGRFGTVSFLPTTLTDSRVQTADNLSWQRGTHSLKVGIEHNLTSAAQKFGFNQFGSFGSFPGSSASTHLELLSRPLPGSSRLGRFDDPAITYDRQIGNLLLDFSGHELAFFFQDNWRLRPSFTLNYGLRWEGQYMPDVDTTNQDLLNEVRRPFPLGQVDPARKPSLGDQVMPRLGFAWDPMRNGKTVLRANFGIFYARTPLLTAAGPSANLRNPPGDLSIRLPLSGGGTNNTIYKQFRLVGIDLNAFTLDKLPVLTPQQVQQIATALGVTPNPFRGTQPIVWLQDFKNPRSIQWGVGLEHELARGLSAFANFNYANTVHLLRNRDINLPVPVIRPTDRSQRPFFGLTTGTLRPNPFLGALTVRQSSARSLYRGGSFGVKVARSRYQFSAHYTLSLNLSDDDGEREATALLYDNGFNLRPDYNYSELDARHNFVAHNVVSLPWGIEVSSIWRFRSALPFSPSTGADSNGDRASTSACFGVPCDRAYQAPGVPFTRNSFRNLANYNTDLRVLKGFRLWSEQAKLQFSAEMFNVFNFENISFLVPGGTSRNMIYGVGIDEAPQATFRRVRLPDGRVDPNNTVGTPFQFQLGLRLVF